MATKFDMPKLGLTMEAGTILAWLVADGDVVAEGQPIMVIETDKVESEVESSGAGVFQAIASVGETYACGAQLGWFLAEGEEAPAGAGPGPTITPEASSPAVTAAAALAPERPGGRRFASPNAKRVAAQRGVDLASVIGTGPGGRIVSEDVEAAAAAPVRTAASTAAVGGPPSVGGGIPLASVAARNLADLLGIDLRLVAPTSPDPRITRDDVARYVRRRLAGGSASTPGAAPSQAPTGVTPLTGMRGTIASRMHASLQEMAQLTLHMDVDMAAVTADRATRADRGTAPGYTDYVIAAAAHALRRHPYVNSQVVADGIALLPDVHVGMAVAVDGGLLVPVVRNADQLAIDALAAETGRLAEAARARKIELRDLEGATFSVTALGMFGVDGFTPVINPPNTAILGVGRVRDDVVWVGDEPQRATVLTLSLTWDHRAFDGAPAAEFVSSIKGFLEAV